MTQDDIRETTISNHLGLSQRYGKRNGPDSYLKLMELDVPTKYIPNSGMYFSMPNRSLVYYLGKHKQQAILGICPLELKGSTRIKFDVKKQKWTGQLSTDARLGLKKINCWSNQYIILSAHGNNQKPVAIRLARIIDLPFLHKFKKTILENSEDFRSVWNQLPERAKKFVRRGLTLNDPSIKWEECEPHCVELSLDNSLDARKTLIQFIKNNPIPINHSLVDQAIALKWPSHVHEDIEKAIYSVLQ